jgi:hypothetical protein
MNNDLENHMVLPQAEEPDPEEFDELEFEANRDDPRDDIHERAFDVFMASVGLDGEIDYRLLSLLRQAFFQGASHGLAAFNDLRKRVYEAPERKED